MPRPWLLAEISLFRVPQLAERIMPFAVLVGAMSCYLTLSRRLELVVARAAGVSAWQFVAPAMIAAFLFGTVATTFTTRSPRTCTSARNASKPRCMGELPPRHCRKVQAASGCARRAPTARPSLTPSRAASRALSSAASASTPSMAPAISRSGSRQRVRRWSKATGGLTTHASIRAAARPLVQETYRLGTNLTPEQVRESFATPETVPFWQLPSYIELADRAGLVAAGYRLQYHLLLARPFLLAAMVLLAASVSLRFFRFGGVQKMVLSGISAGFLLFVLSKVTEDMSKSELMSPVLAAWIPVLVGSLTGFVALLHQEDG